MSNDRPTLAYGMLPHQQSLAFLPEEYATTLAREIAEIRALTTMGAARAYKPNHSFVPGLDEEDEVADDEPYDALETAEHADGDWPRMVAQLSMDVLPADLTSAIGTPVDTVLNGEYLAIPPEAEAEVLATLDSLGYVCRRDDRLILECELVSEADIADAVAQIRSN